MAKAAALRAFPILKSRFDGRAFLTGLAVAGLTALALEIDAAESLS